MAFPPPHYDTPLRRPARYDTPFGRPVRKTNYFAWTVAILLLTGFAFAAWLGSFYIFWQPERPDSYRILRKLKRLDPPRRFELTAAPTGEFLGPKQLHDRFAKMGAAELAAANTDLARNYIRNFQQVHGLVPYVVGRFRLIEVRQLSGADIFTSGMVALGAAVDNGQLLMEHVYPADPQDIPLMKQTLVPGLEVKLERTHDISAVIHADRTSDGRVLITAMPLLYGSYTVTRGNGTFTLEPPLDLNLAAGWPLIKREELRAAEERFARLRPSSALGAIPLPGIVPSGTPPPAENQLVRVEQAAPVETPVPTPVTAPAPEKGKIVSRKNGKSASPSATPFVAQTVRSPAAPPIIANGRSATLLPKPGATPTSLAPAPSVNNTPVAPADGTLASTAGGATWKTYPAGKMPQGRLLAPADLAEIADRGFAGERIYLRGQFVVNFSDANKAVLRPRTRVPDTVVRLAGGNSARIIVEYPSGYVPPAPGSTVTRDEARPLEVTEVRKQEDGQLNVFAREVMQP